MNIIITGASGGIGFQIVKLFSAQKNNKVIALSKDLEGLTLLKEEVVHPQNLSIYEFDVTNYETSDLIRICELFECVDILINNAGLLINKPFLNTSLNEWKQIFDVNLFAPVRIVKELVPKMKISQNPHIVNIGSMGGFQGSVKFKGLSAYSSSKAAIANLTECLAEELKEDKISVNCLCLGAVNTEMFRAAFPEFAAPLQSDEIAKFICDFSMNNSRYINGKILPISISTP